MGLPLKAWKQLRGDGGGGRGIGVAPWHERQLPRLRHVYELAD